MSGSVATEILCVKKKHPRSTHRLRVMISDVRKVWDDLDETDKKNLAGNVRAFCPDSSCPEHHRTVFVGINRIPGLKKIIDA